MHTCATWNRLDDEALCESPKKKRIFDSPEAIRSQRAAIGRQQHAACTCFSNILCALPCHPFFYFSNRPTLPPPYTTSQHRFVRSPHPPHLQLYHNRLLGFFSLFISHFRHHRQPPSAAPPKLNLLSNPATLPSPLQPLFTRLYHACSPSNPPRKQNPPPPTYLPKFRRQ